MLEEIKISDSTSIYKINYESVYSKEEILKKVYLNIDLFGFEDITTSPLHLITNEIEPIKKFAVDNIRHITKVEHSDYIQQNWIYYSKPKNSTHFYHTHKMCLSLKINLLTDWTWTYYLQMPNNISGKEGAISFRVDNMDYEVVPKEGDMLLFPGTLLHTPLPSIKSEIDRVVIAGNVSVNLVKDGVNTII